MPLTMSHPFQPGQRSPHNLAEARRRIPKAVLDKIDLSYLLSTQFNQACSGKAEVSIESILGYDPTIGQGAGGPGGGGVVEAPRMKKALGASGFAIGRVPKKTLKSKQTVVVDVMAMAKQSDPVEVQKRIALAKTTRDAAEIRDREREAQRQRDARAAAIQAAADAQLAATQFRAIEPGETALPWLWATLARWHTHRAHLSLKCDNWLDVSTVRLVTFSIDVTVYNGTAAIPGSKFVFHSHPTERGHFKAALKSTDSRQDRLNDANGSGATGYASAVAFARSSMPLLTPAKLERYPTKAIADTNKATFIDRPLG